MQFGLQFLIFEALWNDDVWRLLEVRRLPNILLTRLRVRALPTVVAGLLLGAPSLYEAIHLLILRLNEVLYLPREKLAAVDKVVCGLRLVDPRKVLSHERRLLSEADARVDPAVQFMRLLREAMIVRELLLLERSIVELLYLLRLIFHSVWCGKACILEVFVLAGPVFIINLHLFVENRCLLLSSNRGRLRLFFPLESEIERGVQPVEIHVLRLSYGPLRHVFDRLVGLYLAFSPTHVRLAEVWRALEHPLRLVFLLLPLLG